MKFIKQIALAIILAASLLAQAQTADREVGFYIENFKVKSGSTFEMPVCISNPGYYFAGFQCDLTFPEGVEMTKDPENGYLINLSDRKKNHIYTAEMVNGALRIVCYSPNNSYFTENDGAIMTVPIQVNAEPGKYPIKISKGIVTETGGDIKSDEYTATMTVLPGRTWGDNQLYAEIEPIAPGQNAVLQVGVNSTSDIYSYEANIELPSGVEVLSVEYSTKFTDSAVSYSTEYSQKENVLSISGEQARKKDPAPAGDYIFVTFELNTSSLEAGEYAITVKDQMLENADDDIHYPEAFTATLTVATPLSFDLNDETEYTSTEDVEFANITYTRNFAKAVWQAIYLPFELEYDDWAELGEVAELYNVHQYDKDGDGVLDTTTIEFSRVNEGKLSAHTPYIFKPNEAGEVKFECDNRTIYGAPATDGQISCESTKERYTLTGTYKTKSGLPALGAYALSSSGVFVKAQSDDQVLKPYRFYLIISDKVTSMSAPAYKPQYIHVVVDGETTGIEDVEFISPANDVYYDLTGRKVMNPAKGIYIVNGQKVFVK